MPIRLTGMNSGLDTEALVSELVSAYRKKGEKYQKAQMKHVWKQDAWKSMSSKLYNFRTKIDSMRFSTSYTLKTTSVSNSTKATITASNNAVNGTQSLNITSLAKAGYLTGAKLKTATGSVVNGGNTLGSLAYSKTNPGGSATEERMTGSGTVRLNGKEITLSADMSIDNIVNKFKDAGVNASFDATNQRIFISSKESGKTNDFALTAMDANGTVALKALGIYAPSAAADASNQQYVKYAGKTESELEALLEQYNNNLKLVPQTTLAASNLQQAVAYNKALATTAGLTEAQKELLQHSDRFVSSDGSIYTKGIDQDGNDCYYISNKDADGKELAFDENGKVLAGKAVYLKSKEIENKSTDPVSGEEKTEKSTVYAFTADKDAEPADDAYTVKTATDYLKDQGMTEEQISENRSALNTIGSFESAVENEKTKGTDLTDTAYAEYSLENLQSAIAAGTIDMSTAAVQARADAIDSDKINAQKFLNENSVLESYAQQYAAADADDTKTESEKAALKADIAKQLKSDADYAATADTDYCEGAVRVDGQDATIYLNGAQYTSSSNSFSINGLSINALATTTTEERIKDGKADEDAVTITTTTDVQGIYDKIKDFISEYNSLINYMTSSYNAPSAKEYEPLTDDEKEAMTESQAEKWEQKGKDSVLRRDSTLDSLLNSMTSIMAMSLKYEDGTKASLASFGIKTLGIMNAEANQQNAYHIDGDADDEKTSGNTDKLMAAIIADPDRVMGFFQTMTGNLYDELGSKMTSTTMRTYGNFYNDKEMAKEYSDYTTTITKWDQKIQDIEDSYYKKFAAMEKALSTLQSQQSQLAGLLGG